MHVLVADETNLEPSKDGRFFIYGGLLLPMDELPRLSATIRRIRREAGFKTEDDFKFSTTGVAKHVPLDAAREAKRQAIEAAKASGAEFIVYAILHDIARRQSRETLIYWAMNTVIWGYHRFLEHHGEHGIVVVDRPPAKRPERYFAEVVQRGLPIDGRRVRIDDRIHMVASTRIGGSHACSVADIVLGSFRYCISNPKNVLAARDMARQVVPMIWHRRSVSRLHVLERGLLLRPKDVRRQDYADEYGGLLDQLNTLLTDAGEEPPMSARARPVRRPHGEVSA